MTPRIPIYKIHHPPSPYTATTVAIVATVTATSSSPPLLPMSPSPPRHLVTTITPPTPPTTSSRPTTRHHPHHRDHNNIGGFSSRCRHHSGLWVADWPPPPRWSLENFRSLAYFSMHGLSAAKPPSWWRSDDGTPPQPHLVMSSCDGATPWGVSQWEYDLWSMRMEQYLTFTDHALWEVIVNGNSVTSVALASTEGPIPPKTAKQKLDGKNELKAKSTLMLAIPDEHLLKFHACMDAKPPYGNQSRIGLDKTYDRFLKLISQLEFHGEVIYQEDAYLKLLRSLASTWNNIALIMRNKFELDSLSMGDLYNNLKVYESKIKIQSSLSTNSQNIAFVSSYNTSNTNEIVNTAHNVFAASSKDKASTAS
nr:hypothetical protein [Tanacetum cinerariifolium]